MGSNNDGINPVLSELQQVLLETADLHFAVLVGSRAYGHITSESDWDIAVQWQYDNSLKRIAIHESLRRKLALVCHVSEDKIDLIWRTLA
ncbi:MAG: nucleotidyltransferase domain-containing protein [Methylococcaceae bacterium]|jgi:hypothetical protein